MGTVDRPEKPATCNAMDSHNQGRRSGFCRAIGGRTTAPMPWQIARTEIRKALSRLAKSGQLRRLARGLYDFPKQHPKLGHLSPAPDDVAQALARETGSHLQIDGARAAIALGLSTQVTAQSSWLTDGPSRRIVLGKRIVDLRHASPKHLIAPDSPAGTVVQALRHVGVSRAADVAQVAARTLSDGDKKILSKGATHAPAWMHTTLMAIAATGAVGN